MILEDLHLGWYEACYWLNNVTNCSVSRPDELSNGVALCLLARTIVGDVLLPKNKVKQSATRPEDCLHNLRMLQLALRTRRSQIILNVRKMQAADQDECHKAIKALFVLSYYKRQHLRYRTPSIKAKLPIASKPIRERLYTPAHGKSSVSSELFICNYSALVDRMKQILGKDEDDSEKVEKLRLLLNVRHPQQLNFYSKDISLSFEKEIKELVTDEKAQKPSPYPAAKPRYCPILVDYDDPNEYTIMASPVKLNFEI